MLNTFPSWNFGGLRVCHWDGRINPAKSNGMRSWRKYLALSTSRTTFRVQLNAAPGIEPPSPFCLFTAGFFDMILTLRAVDVDSDSKTRWRVSRCGRFGTTAWGQHTRSRDVLVYPEGRSDCNIAGPAILFEFASG